MSLKSDKTTKLLKKAVASHQAGDLQQADKWYRRYLKSDPGNAKVLHTLGGVCYQNQDYPSAGEFLEKAHRAAPDNPDYLSDLGAFRSMMGDYPTAVACLTQAVKQAPADPQVHYNLGVALHGAGNPVDAVAALEQAVRLDPDYAAALYNLAVIYFELGQYVQAEEACRKAIELAPGLAQARLYLGEILTRQRRYSVAVSSFQKAYEMDRENPGYLVALVRSLHEERRTEEAIQLLQGSLDKFPHETSLISLLGELLRVAGRIEESEKLYQQALSRQQDMSSVLFNYSRIRKFSKQDENIIRQIEKSLSDCNLPDDSRMTLCFALGKIYDDCNEYDKAFENYRTANNLKHKLVKYNRVSYEKQIDETISVFNRDFFTDFAYCGSEQRLPVFIFGMPRSGTTLTEQIISAHPEVAGADELTYFQSLCKQIPRLLQSDLPWPGCCSSLNKTAADQIVRHYLELLRRYSPAAKLITDKMPQNYYYLGLIGVLFPGAPLIHCRREPLDVCLSIYFQNFTKFHSYAFDLLDIGHKYLQYERLMAHWRQVLPQPLLEVRYEDLVTDQERMSRALIDFCGLEWDAGCLDFYRHKRDVRTASSWQVRQPIYSGSVSRWKNYEKHLGPLMKLFEDARDKIQKVS